MNITLRQLRAFSEVAETGSFTLAAGKMSLTQSAVSMLVRQLETEYGMPLFDRVNREVKLTGVGREMLPLAKRILGDLRQMQEGAADIRALKRGTLRLAVPQMLACSWLAPWMSEFLGSYPEINMDIIDTTGDRVVTAVLDNQAEIGIGPQRPAPAEIAVTRLWEEPIMVVVPATSTIAGAARVKWEDLRGENWIQYSDDFTIYLERLIWGDLAGARRQSAQVRYLTTALAFVGLGLGITAAPSYARSFEKRFGVAFVQIEDGHFDRRFNIYARRGHELSPAAESFMHFLADRMG